MSGQQRQEGTGGRETRETPNANPFDPWGPSLAAWKGMRDGTMETWSKMMIDFVNSEAYSRATAQALDTYLTVSQPFQKVVETTMARVLTQLNMPTRTDVISLAERLTNIELRLDDLDARVDELQRAVAQGTRQGQDSPSAQRAPGRRRGRPRGRAEDATGAADAVDAAAPDKNKGV